MSVCRRSSQKGLNQFRVVSAVFATWATGQHWKNA